MNRLTKKVIIYPESRKDGTIIKVEGIVPTYKGDIYKKFNFWIYDDNMDKLPEQFMIITNHQSLLDIPCFMNVFQNRELRFVAKDALGNSVPLVSKMLKTQEHCIIPRNRQENT